MGGNKFVGASVRFPGISNGMLGLGLVSTGSNTIVLVGTSSSCFGLLGFSSASSKADSAFGVVGVVGASFFSFRGVSSKVKRVAGEARRLPAAGGTIGVNLAELFEFIESLLSRFDAV